MRLVFVSFSLLISLNIFSQVKNYGLSLNCQKNTECFPEFCNEIRSVVLLGFLRNDSIIPGCTGVLLNNEKFDGKPFLFTANHCIYSENFSYSINEKIIEDIVILFNYEADECYPNTPVVAPSSENIIIGAKIVSNFNDGLTDFALLEIFHNVPQSFNPFFSGWTNSKNIPDPKQGFVIHHPRGDIKKFSDYYDISRKYSGYNKRYWYVKDFLNGGIETSSSGAPLYDSFKRVIGNSHRANTNICEDENNDALFGKFSLSWNDKSSHSEQLRHWLNPNGTEDIYINSISGFEPCRENYFFEDAEDLHTSENVNGMPGSTGLLPGTRSYNGVYSASSNISAGQGVTILSNTSVEFQANTIVLGEGLTIEPESNFLAHHKPCIIPCENEDNNRNGEERRAGATGKNSKEELIEYVNFKENPKLFPEVFPNPTNNSFVLRNDNKQREIKIFSTKGKLLFKGDLLPNQNLRVSTLEFGKGIFIIHSLTESGKVYTQKLIVH